MMSGALPLFQLLHFLREELVLLDEDGSFLFKLRFFVQELMD